MPDPNREVLIVYRDWTEKLATSLRYELGCQEGIIATVRNAGWGFHPACYRAVVTFFEQDYSNRENVILFTPKRYELDDDSYVQRTPDRFYENQAGELAEQCLSWLQGR